MSHDFIRVPPDSTGKRIRHAGTVDLEVNNIQLDLKSIDRGSTIIGVTSGTQAKYLGFKIELGDALVFLAEANGTFQVGEELSVTGTPIADVVRVIEMYTPTVHVVDGDAPVNKLKIDHTGSASVTFSEGNPSMDAFGNLQVSNHYRIDDHTFIYGDRPDKYYTQTASGGAISVNAQDSTLVLSCNSTNGSSVTRTSNQYYPYTPGQGTEVLMSVMIGDEGKANVVRRWGLFDDNNGVFFQLIGVVFQVVVRNNSTGVVVDEVVSQANFNGDALNDVNESEYLLALSKFNLYWIDYQWLGVGRVRFGTYAPNGMKVVLHSVNNANSKTVPYMSSGTLPFRLQQFNTSNTASSSEMKMICSAIIRQSPDAVLSGRIFDTFTDSVTVTGNTNYKPIFSARPVTTFAGRPNRGTIVPQDFEFFVDGDACRVDIVVNPTLVGATYAGYVNPFSFTQIDMAATSMSGGVRMNSIMLGPGATKLSFADNFDYALMLNADGVTQPIFTLAAKTLKSNGNTTLTMVVRWKEVR